MVKLVVVDLALLAELLHYQMIVFLLDHESENFPFDKRIRIETPALRSNNRLEQGRSFPDQWLWPHLANQGRSLRCLPRVHVHDAFVVQGAQQVERLRDQAANVAALV